MPRIPRKTTARSAKPKARMQKVERRPTVLTDESSEHYHQVFFVSWFRRVYPSVLIFAIPNGGGRSKAEGGRLKAEGVVPGIPDLYVPAWQLWIEMKRPKKGRLSSAQKGIITHLQSLGHTCVVCYGFEDATAQIADFCAQRA